MSEKSSVVGSRPSPCRAHSSLDSPLRLALGRPEILVKQRVTRETRAVTVAASDHLSPEQFETPVRPEMQKYLDHPYARTEAVSRLRSSAAARDEWEPLLREREWHEKASAVSVSIKPEKSGFHAEAAQLAHRAANEARWNVQFPKDEHPLFGRGGPLEGMTHEEADRHLFGRAPGDD